MESLMQFVQDRAIVYESGSLLTHFAFDCEHRSVFLTMPLTAFVYDYFIYNSLYSVDWEKSCREGQVVEINIKEDKKKRINENLPPETHKQTRFEEFLRKLAIENPQALYKVFSSLLMNLSLEGDHTRIIAEPPRLSEEDGERFFRNLRSLRTLVQNNAAADEKQRYDEVFRQIGECRDFVYKARSSVFHGSSILGVTVGNALEKRINIYDTFLRCILSSFFSLVKDYVR